MNDRQRYQLEPFDGKDDYLPDEALERIAEIILGRLPTVDFDLVSSQATAHGVTATLRFGGCADPFTAAEHLEAILRAATVVRTLHANLVAARDAMDLLDELAGHPGVAELADAGLAAIRRGGQDGLDLP